MASEFELKLTSDSQLMEDYILTAGVPLNSSGPAPMAVFQNTGGSSELLAIHQDGQLYHICREPLSQTGWNMYGAGAALVSHVCVDRGLIYALGSDGSLWQSRKGHWNSLDARLPNNEAPIQLSYTADGNLYALSQSGNLFSYSKSTWQEVADVLLLSQAPVGTTANQLWAVDVNSQVVSNSSGKWQPAGTLCPAAQVAVGIDGSVWAIDNQGALYQYVNNAWQSLAGAPSFLSIAVHDAQTIWGVILENSKDFPWTYGLGYYSHNSWQTISLPTSTVTFTNSNMPSLGLGAYSALAFRDMQGRIWLSAGTPSVASDWQRLIMPTGIGGVATQVTEVVAGHDPQGNAHGFYTAGGRLYHIAFDNESGQWMNNSTFLGECSNLGITNQQDTSDLIAYGVTSTGSVLLASVGGDGAVNSRHIKTNLTTSVPISLCAVDSQSWMISAVVDNTLCAAWGSAENPLNLDPKLGLQGYLLPVQMLFETESPQPAPQNMAEIIRLPLMLQSGSGRYIAARGLDGSVQLIFNLTYIPPSTLDPNQLYGVFGAYTQLTGGKGIPVKEIDRVAGLIDNDGNPRIYATTANKHLWVIRKTGDTSNDFSPWQWSAWHPLGSTCAYLANGSGQHATSELFSIGIDNTLQHLEQSSVSKHWSAKQIKRPTDAKSEADHVTQYRTVISLRNHDDSLAHNVPVQISAAEPTELWVNGTYQHIEPGKPIMATTNHAGQLTVTSIAVGLHTAALVFSANGLETPKTIYPPKHCHNFLAGKEQRLNGQSFDTDGKALQNPLDANGNSFSFGPKPADNLAKLAATVISHAMNVQLKLAPTDNPLPIWSLDLSNPNQPQLGTVSGRKPLSQAQLVPLPNITVEESQWDDFWNDLVGYAEDIYLAMRQGFFKVEQAAVHFASDLQQTVLVVTLSIIEVGQRVIQFTLDSIHDVLNAISSAVNWIEATVDSLIGWLRDLFNWEDIWRMKCVFEHLITSPIKALQFAIEQRAMIEVHSFIKARKQDIAQCLGRINTIFGNKTIGELLQQRTTPMVANPSDLSRLIEQMLATSRSNIKANWLFENVLSLLDDNDSLTTTPNTEVKEALNAFLNQLMNSSLLQDVFKAVSDLKQILLSKAKSTQDLLNLTIADLLTMLDDLINLAFDLLELTADAVLDLLAAMLKYLLDTLTRPIDIPLISWLYAYTISQDAKELRLLDLISLLLAAPGTVVYKLLRNNQAPISQEEAAKILALKFDPSALLGTETMDAQSINTIGDASEMWKILFAVGSVPYLLVNSILDLITFIPEKLIPEEPTEGTAANLVTVIGWVNVGAEIGLQACNWPGGLFNLDWITDWKQRSTAQHWADGSWIGSWIPPLFDGAWMLFSGNKSHPRAEDIGRGIISAEGVILLAVGIAVSVLGREDTHDQLSWYGVAENSVVMLPLASQLLRIKEIVEAAAEEGVNLPAIKIGLNVACNIAVPILHVLN